MAIKGARMQTASLRKGENTGLMTAPVVLSVSVQGLAADVSALLLGADGRVRSDDDLVFYNHPAQDGVSIAGSAVTADLVRAPADVDRMVVVVSADPLQPGAVFTRGHRGDGALPVQHDRRGQAGPTGTW
ncbi:TerD family protein [Streptomyces sp. NBC_00576]|uniref:TerD family protein n=1 Tax=Streptomyces sp. NBC_00576 TaxID=2903665 RepID=UPI002E803905|nr:TerD family protein [Streptomyces sp. NBC_00576]WUB72018.1 TerD family protein [Streptomyces sp. NBC_00576]